MTWKALQFYLGICLEPSKLIKIYSECLHFSRYPEECKVSSNASLLTILSILFGGYAALRKHVVSSRLALNSYLFFIYNLSYCVCGKEVRY
jgi:hypothetical protein